MLISFKTAVMKNHLLLSNINCSSVSTVVKKKEKKHFLLTIMEEAIPFGLLQLAFEKIRGNQTAVVCEHQQGMMLFFCTVQSSIIPKGRGNTCLRAAYLQAVGHCCCPHNKIARCDMQGSPEQSDTCFILRLV